VIIGEEGLDLLPVVTGLDFGHTDPMWTLPVGSSVRVDDMEQRIEFWERATRD
jgi:muramoyltetrapeptide carboxypeptidase LdcA involved in peptidoglycan recycling